MTGTDLNDLYPRKKSRGTRKFGSQEATVPATRRKIKKTAKIPFFLMILADFHFDQQIDRRTDRRMETKIAQIKTHTKICMQRHTLALHINFGSV